MTDRRTIDPHAAVEYLIQVAPQYAKAKAERIYLEEFRKCKKAILMQQHNDMSIGAQEREAYAHPDYLLLIEALRDAVEAEEKLRWMMTAATTRVEVWRSTEASNRAQDRAAA